MFWSNEVWTDRIPHFEPTKYVKDKIKFSSNQTLGSWNFGVNRISTSPLALYAQLNGRQYLSQRCEVEARKFPYHFHLFHGTISLATNRQCSLHAVFPCVSIDLVLTLYGVNVKHNFTWICNHKFEYYAVKFEIIAITGHFGFEFEKNSGREITWLSWRHRTRTAQFVYTTR